MEVLDEIDPVFDPEVERLFYRAVQRGDNATADEVIGMVEHAIDTLEYARRCLEKIRAEATVNGS